MCVPYVCVGVCVCFAPTHCVYLCTSYTTDIYSACVRQSVCQLNTCIHPYCLLSGKVLTNAHLPGYDGNIVRWQHRTKATSYDGNISLLPLLLCRSSGGHRHRLCLSGSRLPMSAFGGGGGRMGWRISVALDWSHKLHIMKPQETSGNLRKPRETSGNIGKPQETSGNLRKPQETSGNLRKP